MHVESASRRVQPPGCDADVKTGRKRRRSDDVTSQTANEVVRSVELLDVPYTR